jgi:predicted nucleic acid-binding protein
MILTIDTFAWLEIIRGTPLGAQARDLMDGADECLSPAIVLAEVADRCFRDGFTAGQVLQELRAISEASTVVPIDPEIALSASIAVHELRQRAREQRRPPPGLGDGLVLATARRSGSLVLTGDSHFHGLRETLWLGK